MIFMPFPEDPSETIKLMNHISFLKIKLLSQFLQLCILSNNKFSAEIGARNRRDIRFMGNDQCSIMSPLQIPS